METETSLQRDSVDASDSTNRTWPLSQTVNGVHVSAANFPIVGQYVAADVCQDMPDNSDWEILAAILKYSLSSVLNFETRLSELTTDGEQ